MFIERMKGQDFIDSSRAYLDYLEEHLENVRRAFDEVSRACEGMYWVGDDFTWHTLRNDVINHDISKFSAAEFTQYRDKFFPVKNHECIGFDDAWENHKSANHHHHETAKTHVDTVHMVIDWTAMGYKFGDTAEDYYLKNKDLMNLEQWQVDEITEIFKRLREYRSKENIYV